MIHEVAKFTSVQESIEGYFMNVNRNKAYEELRNTLSATFAWRKPDRYNGGPRSYTRIAEIFRKR